MQMYLPFGDWSDDGHGKYKKILVEAPSMEHLLQAQMRIKEQYGKNFFSEMAEPYEEPYFSNIVWQALIDTQYPIERFIEFEENNDWEGVESLEEALSINSNPCLALEFVMDAFIWLLNAYGAEIVKCEDQNPIPMICNWTCRGFETVGYGCFWG